MCVCVSNSLVLHMEWSPITRTCIQQATNANPSWLF